MRTTLRSTRAAIQRYRWDLPARLKDPHFTFADITDVAEYEIRWNPSDPRRRFNPVLDALALHPMAQYKNPFQLTQTADPALVKLYLEKAGPLIIRIWHEIYTQRTAKNTGQYMPKGLFSDTFQGRLNFSLVFQHVVEGEEYMNLSFDQEHHLVPEELQRQNQMPYLASQLGISEKRAAKDFSSWWLEVLIKYCLLQGTKNIYGTPYAAFSAPENYGWAFKYLTKEGRHLHWSDFLQRGMWLDLSRSSMAWREIDHFIRKHWGIVVYDEKTDTIDPRLLLENHAALFAELEAKWGVKFHGWNNLFQRGGLNGTIYAGNPPRHAGYVLKTRYPKAFKPSATRDKFLRVHWFKHMQRFETIEEKRQALQQEIEAAKIPWEEVPKKCDRAWLRSVYLETLVTELPFKQISRFDLFKILFPEKFITSPGGIWHEDDFPATRAFRRLPAFRKIKGSSSYHGKLAECGFNNLRFCLPHRYKGKTICRVSADHAIIFSKRLINTDRGQKVEWLPDEAFVFGPLAKRAKEQGKKNIVVPSSALVSISNNGLPNYETVNKLSGDLLEAGIYPHKLTIRQQKDLVRMYEVDKEKGLAEFIKLNKPD